MTSKQEYKDLISTYGEDTIREKTIELINRFEVNNDRKADIFYRWVNYFSFSIESVAHKYNMSKGRAAEIIRSCMYSLNKLINEKPDDIGKLCLSTRSECIVARAGIKSITDLDNNFYKLSNVRNCGPKCLNEIKAKLIAYREGKLYSEYPNTLFKQFEAADRIVDLDKEIEQVSNKLQKLLEERKKVFTDYIGKKEENNACDD